MTHLPQEPSDRDIDDFVDRLEQERAQGPDPLRPRLEFGVLRRYIRKLRRQLRDRDCEILDLQDELVSAETYATKFAPWRVSLPGCCVKASTSTQRESERESKHDGQ